MRILTIYPHYPVCFGRFMTEAFARLGHNVVHIGSKKGGDTGWLGGRETAKPEWQHHPMTIPTGWRPDLVVNMDEYARPKPQRVPEFQNVTHVVYSVSNNVVDLSTPDFDQIFLGLYRGPALKCRDDGTTAWIGCGYAPALHVPSPIPYEERAFDVCFIGAAYNKRQAALDALRDAGVVVWQSMGEIYHDYVTLYHQSRMGLVCAGDWPGPNMRLYETAAMGVLPLVHRNTYEERFHADDAMGWYEDIVEAVKYWLASPAEAKTLIDRAMAWVKPHTWDARAGQILEWFEGQHGT